MMYPPPRGEPAARFPCLVSPSANNLFVNRRGGRARSPEYLQWQNDAGWLIKARQPRATKGPVAILIEAPVNRKRDIDNIQKPVIDLLVKLGLIDDDRWVDDLRIVRTIGRGNMTISIWPIE